MSWVFANGPGDRGSIPGRVLPKTQKMVLDVVLLNTEHYKVRVKGTNPRKGALGSPSTKVANFYLFFINNKILAKLALYLKKVFF